MCALMLSGAQTVGEIRGRSARLYEFSGLGEVEETLHSLGTRDSEPLVTKLPRQPGRKDARFAHLLSGEMKVEQLADEQSATKPARRASDSEKVEQLEQQVHALSTQVENLRQQFEEFKKQFE
jgi:uncharacterized protein YceH (UPF0502 family)